jgi:hypothetical protein
MVVISRGDRLKKAEDVAVDKNCTLESVLNLMRYEPESRMTLQIKGKSIEQTTRKGRELEKTLEFAKESDLSRVTRQSC